MKEDPWGRKGKMVNRRKKMKSYTDRQRKFHNAMYKKNGVLWGFHKNEQEVVKNNLQLHHKSEGDYKMS